MNALLSIIVPVYNTEAWLPRCLESLVGQTYRQLEIICVNDGSTDCSAAILDAYAAKDDRIKVIHQENAGVSAARNRGLDVATGEYVTFVDADDWVELDAYEKVVSCFDAEVDIVCFGSFVDGKIDEIEKLGWERFLKLPDRGLMEVHELMDDYINACIWNKVWRRSVIEKKQVRFGENMEYSEDECFFYCTLSETRKLKCIPDLIYHYFQHSGSTMNNESKRETRAESSLQGVYHVLNFYTKNGVLGRMKIILLQYFSCCYANIVRNTDSNALISFQKRLLPVMQKGGLTTFKSNYAVREVLESNYNFIIRLFCRYRANRLCFGIAGFNIASITYEDKKTIFRLLGCKIMERYKG